MLETSSSATTDVIPATKKAPTDPAGPPNLSEIVVGQLTALRVYLRCVLVTDDPDAIHKMRVTTRRLQASLDLLQYGGDGLHVRRLKKRFRKWRGVLSNVRNYDVFLSLIEREIAGRSPAFTRQFDPLRNMLLHARQVRARKARRYFQKISLTDMASKMGLELIEPSLAPEAVDEPSSSDSPDNKLSSAEQPEAAECLNPEATAQITGTVRGADDQKIAQRAAERLEQRLGEFQWMAAQAHPTTDPAQLHQLRIAAKRLRYLLENVSGMGFGDATRALTWLRSLQDRIGEWHDLEALESEIIIIVSRRKFMRDHLVESGHMLLAASHLQRKKEKLVVRIFPLIVPRSLSVTAQRLAKALRKKAMIEPTAENEAEPDA